VKYQFSVVRVSDKTTVSNATAFFFFVLTMEIFLWLFNRPSFFVERYWTVF